MNKIAFIAATLATSLMTSFAFAETHAEQDTQRNVNQQHRIEQGLQSGELTTHEAGKLARQQAHVNKMESRAMRNGKIGTAEQARIDTAQDHASRNIAKQKHDGQEGNPNSASSQRMQANIQRNINQQTRINNGLASGQLTTHEASRLERGQSHVQRREANAAIDGHVAAMNQQRIQRSQHLQSQRIYRQKHD